MNQWRQEWWKVTSERHPVAHPHRVLTWMVITSGGYITGALVEHGAAHMNGNHFRWPHNWYTSWLVEHGAATNMTTSIMWKGKCKRRWWGPHARILCSALAGGNYIFPVCFTFVSVLTRPYPLTRSCGNYVVLCETSPFGREEGHGRLRLHIVT